jgi:hypothetical protein
MLRDGSVVQSRVMSYMTQLAIITPYAQFNVRFQCSNASRNFSVRFVRCAVHAL